MFFRLFIDFSLAWFIDIFVFFFVLLLLLLLLLFELLLLLVVIFFCLDRGDLRCCFIKLFWNLRWFILFLRFEMLGSFLFFLVFFEDFFFFIILDFLLVFFLKLEVLVRIGRGGRGF